MSGKYCPPQYVPVCQPEYVPVAQPECAPICPPECLPMPVCPPRPCVPTSPPPTTPICGPAVCPPPAQPVCYPTNNPCYVPCHYVCPKPLSQWDRQVFQATYNLLAYLRSVDVNVFEHVHGKDAGKKPSSKNLICLLEYKESCAPSTPKGTSFDDAKKNFCQLKKLMSNNYMCPNINYLDRFINFINYTRMVSVPDEYKCKEVDPNNGFPCPYIGKKGDTDFLNDLQCVQASSGASLSAVVGMIKDMAYPENALRWKALNDYVIDIKEKEQQEKPQE